MSGPDRVLALQRAYYRDTAARYDGMHEVAEHRIALEHIVGYLARMGASSVLDTGCGTGLGMRYISRALPMVEVRGNDASPDLLQVASELHGIAPERLDLATSEKLPYDDDAFDAVVATGLMHHVPEPDKVIAEMVRVARQAVFISDVNRFGIGSLPVRLARLALAATGLWAPLNRRRLGGQSWHFSEADGVAWSYSVFDSRATLVAACAEVVMIPTVPPRPRSPAFARVRCSHLLLCGFSRPLAEIARGS